MSGDLLEARRVRALVAEGRKPRDDWPVYGSSEEKEGQPVPKCSMFECCEPGIFVVSCRSLVRFSGASQYACTGHVHHFARASADWVSV